MTHTWTYEFGFTSEIPADQQRPSQLIAALKQTHSLLSVFTTKPHPKHDNSDCNKTETLVCDMYLNRQMNCSDVWSGCGFWTDRNQIEKNPAELSTHTVLLQLIIQPHKQCYYSSLNSEGKWSEQISNSKL